MARPPLPLPLPLPLLLLLLLPPPAVVVSAAAIGPSFVLKILPHLPSNKAIKRAIDIADLLRELNDRFGPPNDAEERAATSIDLARAAPVDIAALLVFNVSVGTPPERNIAAIMDITSQLVWAQCGSPSPAFKPRSSATFSTVPCASRTCQAVLDQPCAADAGCGYVATYGGATNTTGVLANDTFTFGETPVPGVVFGCSGATAGDFSGASGVVGFGRGPLSLVSQLNLSTFSYALAPPGESGARETSFIQLGAAASQTKRRRSTPLLRSSMYPDRYYVKLTGMRVDGELLKGIPAGALDLRPDGSGGVFLSTTTPTTFLDKAAYAVVRSAIASSIQSKPANGSAAQGVGGLCYAMDVKVPRLTMVFDGKDAAMELKPANYFFPDDTTGLQCLAILPSSGWSVLGSLMQTGRTMVYDLAGEQLTFETDGDGKQLTAGAAGLQVWTMMEIVAPSLLVWVLMF